jgi:hypothetical protein
VRLSTPPQPPKEFVPFTLIDYDPALEIYLFRYYDKKENRRYVTRLTQEFLRYIVQLGKVQLGDAIILDKYTGQPPP